MGEYADMAIEAEMNEWLEEMNQCTDLDLLSNSCPGCGRFLELCICDDPNA